MNLGGAFSFEGFSVKLVPALHSNSVRDGETLLYAGVSAGVLLTMGGLTFYHLGDTALFSDLELVGRLHRIDAAAVPIGGNYTMGPDEGVLAAQWIKPGLAIPVHYNTFSAIMQDGEAFARNCEENGIPCRVLDIGESLEL
jgi:L-ascorbate metabolism protein UlaG (beta-lactamase superfamily)